jgi:hypothetical protein
VRHVRVTLLFRQAELLAAKQTAEEAKKVCLRVVNVFAMNSVIVLRALKLQT